MSVSRALVSVRVEAAPVIAFDAFTREIGAWWVHNDLLRHTPKSPGVLAFEEPTSAEPRRLVERLSNGKTFVIGEVAVWEPPKRLVVGWRQASFGPDHATEVEVRFEAVGGQTRVTVEHRGWDSVPIGHIARHGFPLPNFLAHQGEQWRASLRRFAKLAGSWSIDGSAP